MSGGTRLKVLSLFKKLHRAKDKVFVGDSVALDGAKMKIREEFSKHKAITDPQEINSLLKVAQESEELLRTKVVQLSQVRKDVYQFRTEHLQEKCFKLNMKCDDCTCGR
ncbi:complex III assembly factor LYRM7 [Folsomia candida]|uniref:Complex III assembly factor LYRM7 n=1 Tax=Folsomia candida TaxID=158441 RepID=A0A226DPA8_FOLCA|nr:complex III assembly factor LYRM7 [Folsomia candida]OXA46858.1 Complex III assembly factor LYRM7 [Folsomia candida]